MKYLAAFIVALFIVAILALVYALMVVAIEDLKKMLGED